MARLDQPPEVTMNAAPTYSQSLHSAIVAVAQAVVAGSIGPVEASRRFMGLAAELGVVDSEPFKFFIEVDACTDHHPLGQIREHWNSAALKREDSAREQYESNIRAEAIAQCRKLIEIYTEEGKGA
jgi:hypothetical protein